MPKRLTIKNRHHEIKLFSKRLSFMAVIMLLMVGALLAQLIYLQISEHQRYTTLSDRNQLNLIPIAPPRGLILDRRGVPLAENIPVYSLDIIPDKVKNLDLTITQLKKIIAISPDDLKAFDKLMHQHRHFEPIPLKFKLSVTEVSSFAVNQWRFPGVAINARLLRNYPQNSQFAHVVGFTGRINTAELNEFDSTNYSATNYIGKVGIEKYFENELHGTVGFQQVETDASGRVVRELKHTAPIPGATLYLTIDAKLQVVATEALEDAPGAVVAIEPKSGQILAMVSNPAYDPNLFVKGISNADYKKLQSSPQQPLYNRAIRGLYAPGSTVKPFMALAGLDSKTVTRDYQIYDYGYFKYANHRYYDYSWRQGGHGWVNLESAIMVSCDTYFYNLAVMLGIDRMDRYLAPFGFGQSTHIEMKEELAGILPSPAWKRSKRGAAWYTGDTINTGIGQGFMLITPVQLAGSVATLALRGQHVQPHLLYKMQLPSGKILFKHTETLPPVNLPAAEWNTVIQGMHDVIINNHGTGFRFGRTAPYTVAAKTGTAQVYRASHNIDKNEELPWRLRDNSLFIAFAPIDNPKIVVAIVAEHSELAANVARKVMDFYLLKEGYLYQQ